MKLALKGSGFICSFGIVAGILCTRFIFYISFYHIISFSLAAISLILAAVYFVKLRAHIKLRLLYLVCILVFFMISYTASSHRLPASYYQIEDKEGNFIGEIKGDLTRGENVEHYPFELKSFDGKRLKNNIIVRLSKNIHRKGIDRYFPGDVLEVEGSLEVVLPATNPGEFDYREFLFTRGKNYLIYPDEIEKKGSNFNIFRSGSKLADYIKQILSENLPERTYSWASAVSFGDRSALNEVDRDNLQEAGASHIVAVSGLHMGIIGMGLFTFLKKNSLEKKYAGLITLGVIWFYTTMVGLRPSVLRAGIMLTIFIAVEVLKGRTNNKIFSSFDSLLFSFNILLLIFPWYFFNVGFQLSFSATFFILLVYPYLNEITGDIKIKNVKLSKFNLILEPVKISLAALTGVFPLLLYHFGYVSFGSLLVSPLIFMALPLLIFLTFLGSSLIFFGPVSSLVFTLLNFIGIYLIMVVDFAARVSPDLTENWSIFQVICFYGMFFSLFYLFKSSLVVSRLRVAFFSLLVCSTVFISLSVMPILDRDVQVVYLDVGHGDSIYINTPDSKSILIDGGGVYDGSLLRDPGESILVPFLKEENVDKIDIIVATHPHVDHIGGLREVIRNFEVGVVIIPDLIHTTLEYEEFLDLIEQKNIQKHLMTDKMEFIGQDNLKLEFLYPKKPYLFGTGSDLNNNSVVVRLIYNEISFLFTGDLESEGEKRLLEQDTDLKSTILKVGHHGSATSSTSEFLREASPAIAVISAGRNSPYGFPSPLTLERLENKNIAVLRTDQWGAVEIITCGENIEVKTFLDSKID